MIKVQHTSLPPQSNDERGSVFIYILLAISLLAGLSFAVSRGNRGSTSHFTEQQAQLAAQEIIDYGNTVANAVQKLRLRGCTDTQVSFENNIIAGYTNPNAPSDKSCHVFDLNGGGATFILLDDAWTDSAFSSSARYKQRVYVAGARFIGIGSNKTELFYYEPHLKVEICEAINNILSLNINTPPPEETFGGGSHIFNGDSTDYDPLPNPDIGDEVTEVQNKTEFCLKAASYYHAKVLIAR